jgi:hypothetical protein
MTILVSAVIAVLSAQTALAEQRDSKAFNTVNGRTTVAAPAGPRIFTVNTPAGGAAANGPAAGQAPAVTNDMINGAPTDGGRAFIGAGRPAAASRASSGRAVRRGGRAFFSGPKRKVDGGGAGGATTTGADAPPPNFDKPGALIRTTGQQPKYEKAEDPQTHTTDAGEIVFNNRKGFDVGRAPSVHQGPKDTLPPPNPGTGGSNYSGGAAANTGAGSGSSGSGSSGTGGHDNNGSGNNDKNKPGDDYDPQGGDKAMATSFSDAF